MKTRDPAFLHVYADPPALYDSAAEMVAALAGSTVESRGRFAVALSGGNTPKQLYHLLATDFRLRIPWDLTHLFWGDERFVPDDDPLSNYRMVKEELLDRIEIPESNIHSIPTGFPDPEAAASAYERSLHTFFAAPVPSFDLILLGMGSDGHIASLFPGTAALEEKERWVVPVRTEAEPPIRISLTLPVLNAARRIMVLVTGTKKRTAVKQVFRYGEEERSLLPAALLRPAGELHWLVDREAAGNAG